MADARLTRLAWRVSRCTAAHHGELTFSLVYRGLRTTCSRRATTRAVHGGGLAAGARCPVTASSSWRTRAPTWRSCGPTRQAAALRWGPRWVRSRSGRVPRARLVAADQIPEHRGSVRPGPATNKACIVARPRSGRATATPARLPVIDAKRRGRNLFPGSVALRRCLTSSASPTSAAESCTPTSGWGCPRPRGDEIVNTDAEGPPAWVGNPAPSPRSR